MSTTWQQAIEDGQRVGSRYALLAPRVAPLGIAGMQLGHRAGSSVEFMDHREYQPGDDLRRIDWNAYARSDRVIVKLYREEVSPHLDLMIDASASMALDDSAKQHATLALAAALATAAFNSRFTCAAWHIAEGFTPIAGGHATPEYWQPFDFGPQNPTTDTLAASPVRLRHRGVRVLVSDLLMPGDPTPLLARLTHDAAWVGVIQLLAEDDVTPPQPGSMRLVDAETGELREVFIDSSMRARYQQRLANHQQTWHRACQQHGATMVSLIAERFTARWDLADLLQAQLLKVI